MKKKVIFVLIALGIWMAPSSAQILKGTWIVNPQLSGFNMGSSRTLDTGKSTFDLGVRLDAGKFMAKNFAVLVGIGGDFSLNKKYSDSQFDLQGGIRFYPFSTLFIGANVGYTHAWRRDVGERGYTRRDYLYAGADIGYAFFVCQNASIDPAIYIKHSLTDRLTQYGLKVGFSIYL